MNRFEELYRIMNEWMFLREEGKNISDILNSIDVKNIAVYGMGDCAIHLIRELSGGNVQVKSLIVDCEDEYEIEVPVAKLGDEIPDVDLIIYTDSFLEQGVQEKLKNTYGCKVISMADVVFQLI